MSEVKLPPTKRSKSKEISQKVTKTTAVNAPEKASRPLSPWERGARSGLKRSLYVAAPVLVWMILSIFGLISVSLSTNLLLCFSVALYLLGIPLSILFGLDSFALEWAPDSSNETIMLVFLLVVSLNFTLIGAIRGWLRGDVVEEQGLKKEKT